MINRVEGHLDVTYGCMSDYAQELPNSTSAISEQPDWEEKLQRAFSKLSIELEKRRFEAEVMERLTALENRNSVFSAYIASFADLGFATRKTVPVFITESINPDAEHGLEYIATFVEANISVTAETLETSVDDLKNRIVSLYRFYSKNEKSLGKLPARQFAILKDIIEPSK